MSLSMKQYLVSNYEVRQIKLFLALFIIYKVYNILYGQINNRQKNY